MNTTDYTIDIPAYTYYGMATLTTTQARKKQEPGRICLIEPQPYSTTAASATTIASAAATKKESSMTPLNLRDHSASKEDLPAWMQGATTEQNKEKRLQHLIRYFKLDQTPCLPTPKDVHTAALLLLRYWEVFSFDGSFGTTTLVKHEIKLKPGHEKPINTGFRPINPSLEPDLRRQLDKWLSHGIIERSQSPWAFSLVNAPTYVGVLIIASSTRPPSVTHAQLDTSRTISASWPARLFSVELMGLELFTSSLWMKRIGRRRHSILPGDLSASHACPLVCQMDQRRTPGW